MSPDIYVFCYRPISPCDITVTSEWAWWRLSNYRRLDRLFNRLFRCRSKKISKVRVTGICERNLLVTGFPSQRASNTENVSIWWRHHWKKTVASNTSEFRGRTVGWDTLWWPMVTVIENRWIIIIQQQCDHNIPLKANIKIPTMHLSHIPKCAIQNKNVYSSVLNGALWVMGRVCCGICEFVLMG